LVTITDAYPFRSPDELSNRCACSASAFASGRRSLVEWLLVLLPLLPVLRWCQRPRMKRPVASQKFVTRRVRMKQRLGCCLDSQALH
jgi:hypothetical protein